jgi:hypothetical protein
LENALALIAQASPWAPCGDARDTGGLDENVKAIVDSIINSSKHQYGRYLETFR